VYVCVCVCVCVCVYGSDESNCMCVSSEWDLFSGNLTDVNYWWISTRYSHVN